MQIILISKWVGATITFGRVKEDETYVSNTGGEFGFAPDIEPEEYLGGEADEEEDKGFGFRRSK
jgi:hypothetical protein